MIPFVVRSAKRVLSSEARQVNVVFDDHDVSNFKVWTEASRGIGHHQGLHTHQLEDPHWEGHLEHKSRYTTL